MLAYPISISDSEFEFEDEDECDSECGCIYNYHEEEKPWVVIKECPFCRSVSGIIYTGYTTARCNTCGINLCLYISNETNFWCVPVTEFTEGKFALAPREKFRISVSALDGITKMEKTTITKRKTK